MKGLIRTFACAAACFPAGLQAEADEPGFSGGVSIVYQRPEDNRVDPEITGSGDFFFTLPQSRGEWLIYLEASTASRRNGVSSRIPSANADVGSALETDGDGTVQISELNYTFSLSDGNSLMVGLIDPSAWLDRSRLANDENQRFLNTSFVNNATIEFPDYTLGSVLRLAARSKQPELTLVVSGSDGLADLDDRYRDLFDVTGRGRGLFVGAGVGWVHERVSLRLGGWFRSDKRSTADRPDVTRHNYGAYGVLGLRSGPHGLSFRAGLANERVSAASRFISAAYELQTPVGLLGAGVARTFHSSAFDQPGLDHSTDVEIFFRIPVAGGRAQVAPSVQYIVNPSFDASGTVADAEALVFGARFRWTF